MATTPPNGPSSTPPPGMPPSAPPAGSDPRAQRRYYRDQARAQRAAWKAQHKLWRWRMRGMRRASVLGPLMLIGAGFLFLLMETGRIDRRAFFASYARWWPLLLVGAGLVVLGEWALDQMHMSDPDRPQYRRSIGGGVIVLLLFFAFLGAWADTGYSFSRTDGRWIVRGLNFDQDSWTELLRRQGHEFDQTVDLALPAGSSIAIVNPHGNVTVTGTSDDGRIHIAEHKTIYAFSDSEAEDRAKQLAPQTSTEGLEAHISVASVDGTQADLAITVPPEAAATVNANRGDINISAIEAAVTAVANHGDIELAAIAGPVTVHINNAGSSLTARSLGQGISVQGHANEVRLSDITGPVAINGEIFGDTHLERINGETHLHTSRNDVQLVRLDGDAQIGGSGITIEQAQGPVVLSTGNRNVSLDRIAGDIAVTNRNGAVEVIAAPKLGNVTIEDRNGSVRTTLPEHNGFIVQATTTNGNIDTNLQFASGNGQVEPGSGRNQKTLMGTVGTSADAPTVHVTATNGDISIMKGDVEPLTPPAPPAKITIAPPVPAKAPRVAKDPKAPAAPTVPTPLVLRCGGAGSLDSCARPRHARRPQICRRRRHPHRVLRIDEQSIDRNRGRAVVVVHQALGRRRAHDGVLIAQRVDELLVHRLGVLLRQLLDGGGAAPGRRRSGAIELERRGSRSRTVPASSPRPASHPAWPACPAGAARCRSCARCRASSSGWSCDRRRPPPSGCLRPSGRSSSTASWRPQRPPAAPCRPA